MTTSRTLGLLIGVLLLVSAAIAVMGLRRERDDTLVWVSDNNPARLAQMQGFNEDPEQIDVRLDYGNAGAQKVILQSVSGVGPDLFDFSDELLGTYVESGVLWDVTDAAEAMGFSAARELWPAARHTVVHEGRQYGYPCNTSADILVFNKNVFDHFGIPYPEGLLTWQEFFEVAQKVNSLTAPGGGGTGRIYAITGLNHATFFASLRGEYFHEDGRLNIRHNESLHKAIAMHRDCLYRYRITPTAFEASAMSGQGGWGTGSLNQFGAGRYAMAVTGHWSLIALGRAHRLQTEAWERTGKRGGEIGDPLERPIRIGACLLPRFADREPCYWVGSRVAGINRYSPRRELALEFLRYLAGPKYSRILNEGTDALPGNPRYANLGVTDGPADLSRRELQETTEKAMAMGYVRRSSPFLLLSDVNRVVKAQISRLESNPDIPIQDLLDAADRELGQLMRRNLMKNPDLRGQFVRQFGSAELDRLK